VYTVQVRYINIIYIFQEGIGKQDDLQTQDQTAIEDVKKPNLDNDHCLKNGGYYAVFYTLPKLEYYWGKIVKTFSESPEEPNHSVECEFLTKKNLSSDKKQWTWVEKTKSNSKSKIEIPIVDCKYVFYGPVKANYNKGLFKFNDEEVSRYLEEIMAKKSP
jgi:hypothetical protein